MRTLLVLGMMAALLIEVSALVGGHGTVFAERSTTFQFGVGGAASGPSTTNNDDSCDISVAPAATLLLPYFEVDFNSPATTATTTLFTITNTSDLPQIAHVVIWSDFSFPVLGFNIFLTGYDVQAINMWDIFNRGIIRTEAGTSVEATVPANPTAGSQPADNHANPHHLANIVTQCGVAGGLPGQIPTPLLNDLRWILTTGRGGSAAGIFCAGVTNVLGATHSNAIGYVTIDVAATCSLNLHNQAAYFTGEILFDNVLIGDYQQVNPHPAFGNFAGGSPMVHIRAIPEGGPAGSIPVPNATNLPFTFYDRYTNGLIDRQIDRRQPLPSEFVARYIQGGTGNFNTDYKIWREGFTGNTAACTVYVTNANIDTPQIVRFDEHENATVRSGSIIITPLPGNPGTNAAQRVSTSSGVFPPMSSSGDVGGWMYLNLNNGGDNEYSAQRDGFTAGAVAPVRTQSQNWVIVSMFAQGRFSVDFDAAWLGNGCSAARAEAQIGPSGGDPVCPPEVLVCVGNPLYNGTNTSP